MKNLIFIISLSFVFTFGQSKYTLSQNEYQKLHDKARFHINSLIDSSFYYANKIELSNNNLHKSFAYGIKSYLYQIKGDSIKSNKFYNTSISYLNKIQSSTEKTKLHSYLLNYKGLAEWKRGNLHKASLFFNNGLKLSESIDDELQIIKFYSNLVNIYFELQNFNLAIKLGNIANSNLEKIHFTLDENQYFNQKSNINLVLGNSYFNKFKITRNPSLLDSSYLFNKKALEYSNDIINNKVSLNINIATIYLEKKKYKIAEKIYNNALQIAIENKFENKISSIYYNLGYINYVLKLYTKSKYYFHKQDSIFKITPFKESDFIFSNYYLSKIYNSEKDFLNAKKHSSIFLNALEKYNTKIKRNELEVNYNINTKEISKELNSIYNYNKRIFYFYFIILSLILSLACFFLIYNYKKRKKAELKTKEIIKNFQKEKNIELEEKNNKTNITIDNETEQKILVKLKKLEEDKFYLKPDFTQQEVAKKIKTNTTYLSYVFNKNYNTTFSAYFNELRLNYVINEIIYNKTFREYTTQAIAESAGYKNADSFTKSFKKKTGITPFTFINEIKKREI